MGITRNFIQYYALISECSDDDEDQFYKRLQSIISKSVGKDLIISMGDLKSKVGMDDTGNEKTIGQHDLEKRNENGERFVDLCDYRWQCIPPTILPWSHQNNLHIIRSIVYVSLKNSENQRKQHTQTFL